jgi:ABC-type polar amino acid transport system ATPase subunit
MAWVVPPTLRARTNVFDTFNLFPHIAINLFENVELAVSWLQQTAPPAQHTRCFSPGHSYVDGSKLRGIIEAFAQQLARASSRTAPRFA